MIKTRDGTQLYVKAWGHGPAVVLIHGWPLNADSWDPVMNALAQSGYRAIAYDRRGFGRSDQPGQGYDYDTFADDLADVLEATDARPGAALVGFSMGGGKSPATCRAMARTASPAWHWFRRWCRSWRGPATTPKACRPKPLTR
jgi:pimeloyl-ACP methyl ester carboxylesterase